MTILELHSGRWLSSFFACFLGFIVWMTLPDTLLNVRCEVCEDFRWQLVMLAANSIVENVRSVLVFDNTTLPEREIVIPRAHRKDGSEAVP